MNRKKMFKACMPAFFVLISYWIAERYRITEFIYSFNNDNWNTTVSIAAYTAILNTSLEYFLSKRTKIKVEITDTKNKSSKCNIGDKPVSIKVIVSLEGNLNKIAEKIILKFPKWVDLTVKGSPDISQMPDIPFQYLIDLSDDDGKESKRSFIFDVVENEMYSESERHSEITASSIGRFWSKFRYAVEIKGMSIFKN